jgi:hypothetical protein
MQNNRWQVTLLNDTANRCIGTEQMGLSDYLVKRLWADTLGKGDLSELIHH